MRGRRASAAICALICLAVGAPARAEWALGPGAEPAVRRLAAAVTESSGLAPGPTRVAGGEVVFTLRDPQSGQRVEVVMRHDGPGTATRHGVLTVPEGVEAGPIAAALDAVALNLPWVEVGESARPLSDSRTLPPTDEAARARATALRLAHQAARDAWPEPSTGSARPPNPAPGADPHGARDRLRTVHGEPALWVAAARAASADRRPREAIALADVATRMDQDAPEATALWRALRAPQPGHPLATLLLAGALLAWLLLTWSAARPLFPVAAVAALAGLAAWLALARPAEPLPAPPRLPTPLVAPLAGGPCPADPGLWTPEGLVFYASCDGAPATFTITEAAPDAPAPHRVRAEIQRPGPASDAATYQLQAALRAAEAHGFALSPYPADPAPGTARLPPPGSADALEARLCAAFMAAALACLLALLARFGADLLAAARADRLTAITLALLLGATVALHALLPSRLVMVYTGYDLTARLGLTADLPRYGAGAIWLYQPFLAFFGLDHASLQLANRVFGALSLVPFAVLAFAVAPGRRAGPLVATALFALLPVVWRDHVSEAILAGTTLLVLTGLAGAALALTRPARAGWLFIALPVLAAAVTCRPEVAPALAPALLGLALTGERTRPTESVNAGRRRRLVLAAAAAILLAATAPHLLWLAGSAARQTLDGSILPADVAMSTRLVEVLGRANIFLAGPWAPAALLVWAALALLDTRERRPTAVGLWLAALVWIAISALDLPEVSIPRVHLPAMVLLLPACGLGFERIQRLHPPALRLANPVIAAFVLVGAVTSFAPLFTPSNADAEDALIRAARAALPPTGGCLATVRFDDPPPPGHTQRHFPDYLFPGTTIVGLSRFDAVGASCEGRAVALLGTRCSMALRPPGAPPPSGPPQLEVCTRFRQRYALEPVLERTLPNRTAHTFPMYPATPTLDVGVYRVGARRGGDARTPTESPPE
ncbi:MAG: hypothetical protein H6746_02840 [Deltaproteobacteria bacterium]|nr:hypothetical protein [Deltaproteobacteria bacterium]